MTCLGSLHWLLAKQKDPKEQITPPRPVRKSADIKLFVKWSHCVSNFSCVCSLWKATGSSRWFQNTAGQNLILLKLSFYTNCCFSLHRFPLLFSAKFTAVKCFLRTFISEPTMKSFALGKTSKITMFTAVSIASLACLLSLLFYISPSSKKNCTSLLCRGSVALF